MTQGLEHNTRANLCMIMTVIVYGGYYLVIVLLVDAVLQ